MGKKALNKIDQIEHNKAKMEDERVKPLAETLMKNGLAASMYEAIEKAKSILNVNTQKIDASQAQTVQQSFKNMENKKPMLNLGIDIKNEKVTLNELMREVNVSPEEVEALEQERLDSMQEKIDDIKEDIKQAEESPEKAEQVREEVANLKDEVNKIIEEKTEELQESKQDPEEDMFREEKKVDLAKIFNQNKKQ